MNKTIKYILISIFCIAIVLVIIAYWVAMQYQWLGPDTAYYIGTVQQMARGHRLYAEIYNGYTPVFFYAQYIVQLFSSRIESHIALNYIMHFCTSIFVGLCTYKSSKSTICSLSSALLFLLLVYHLEGTYVGLEPFVVFWGMLSIWIIYAKERTIGYMWMAGICASLSFLSKQYGLVFCGVDVVMLWLMSPQKDRIKYILHFIGAFAVPIVLFIIWLLVIHVPTQRIIALFTGGGYGHIESNSYWLGWLELKKIWMLFVAIPVVGVLNLWFKMSNKLWLCCLVGILLASIQFYFQPYKHYAIIMAPFVVWMLFSVDVSKMDRLKKILYVSALCVICSYPTYKTTQFMYKYTKYLQRTNPRESQKNDDMTLTEVISEEDANSKIVYVHPVGMAYVYRHFTPPLLAKYGFSFGFDPIEVTLEKMYNADYIVIGEKDLSKLKDESMDTRALMDAYECIQTIDSMSVYKKVEQNINIIQR